MIKLKQKDVVIELKTKEDTQKSELDLVKKAINRIEEKLGLELTNFKINTQ
jgi:hypothetical protein